jgi:phospholipase/carboxylesterase
VNSVVYRGKTLQYLTVYPDAYEEASAYPLVICLHGYGADMHDLEGLARVIHRTGYRFVFPNAPLPAFDGVDGSSRAWHERGGNETAEAVRDALAALDVLVRELGEKYSTPPEQTLLMGFSQGGAITLRYGLPRPEQFVGLGVLSGSLRKVEELLPDLPPARTQPILVAHGRSDALVPVEWSKQVVAFLEKHGYRPTYRLYPMGHQINPTSLNDLREWLLRTLPPRKTK